MIHKNKYHYQDRQGLVKEDNGPSIRQALVRCYYSFSGHSYDKLIIYSIWHSLKQKISLVETNTIIVLQLTNFSCIGPSQLAAAQMKQQILKANTF